MAQTMTTSVSDEDYKALEVDMVSVQEWHDNFIAARAAKSKLAIITKLTEHCNANSIAMAVGEAAQITQAYDLGVVDTAANVRAALLNAQAADTE